MKNPKLIISPKTKVGEFLEAYPELEKTLLEMSPAFAKLKNPILRKTIGRVATLQQAAAIGNLKVDELVNRLRKEAGQSEYQEVHENESILVSEPPAWFDPTKITLQYDATPVINAGDSPMNDIITKTKQLADGEILAVITPFVPAPIIDLMKMKGFEIFSMKRGNDIITYFKK